MGEIIELISFQTSDAITEVRVPKRSFVFSINLINDNEQ